MPHSVGETEYEEVAIRIEGAAFSGGRKFRFWESAEIRLALDSFSTVGFTAPFAYDDPHHREAFRPFSYRGVEVSISDELVFNGTMVGISPSGDAEKSVVAVTAYALPAVLEDCTEPATALPLEFNGLSLKDIARALVKPWALGVDVGADSGTPFDRVALESDQSPHALLADLARQRGLVLSNTADGKLLCWRSINTATEPVARLRYGDRPLLSISTQFSPQEYFSQLTGLAKTKGGADGSQYTARNPWLSAVLRPKTFKLDDTDDADVVAATKAKLGRMFANAVTWTVEVPTWRDPSGKLWAPNTLVTLHAPPVMVYRESTLLLRAVTFKQDAESFTATLELVLPGAFSGESPETLPWLE